MIRELGSWKKEDICNEELELEYQGWIICSLSAWDNHQESTIVPKKRRQEIKLVFRAREVVRNKEQIRIYYYYWTIKVHRSTPNLIKIMLLRRHSSTGAGTFSVTLLVQEDPVVSNNIGQPCLLYVISRILSNYLWWSLQPPVCSPVLVHGLLGTNPQKLQAHA